MTDFVCAANGPRSGEVPSCNRSHWTGFGMDRTSQSDSLYILDTLNAVKERLPPLQESLDAVFAPWFGLRIMKCISVGWPLSLEGKVVQRLHAWWFHFQIPLDYVNPESNEILSKSLEGKSTRS